VGITSHALKIHLLYHGSIEIFVTLSTLGAGFSGAAVSGPERRMGISAVASRIGRF